VCDGLLGAAAREGGTAPELGGTAASGVPFTDGSRASSARVGLTAGGAGSTEPPTGTEASATVPMWWLMGLSVSSTVLSS